MGHERKHVSNQEFSTEVNGEASDANPQVEIYGRWTWRFPTRGSHSTTVVYLQHTDA